MTAAVAAAGLAPGRVCPLDYATDTALFRAPATLAAEVLYVVGGLYGNAFALDAIERMAAAEAQPVTLVLNGDAHWFDAEPGWFAALDRRLARHHHLAGNVEAEVARAGDIGAGCGCAYPAEVDDGVVTRSNAILGALAAVARQVPGAVARLAALPRLKVVSVAGERIAVLHGDETSLAGWGLAHDRIDTPQRRAALAAFAADAGIAAIASTHTCAAVMRVIATARGPLVVANNGAAGMGNFTGDVRGLMTRIAAVPGPHAVLARATAGAAVVEAVPVAFDPEGFMAAFDRVWPEGSPAAVSYRQRIAGGPAHGRDIAFGTLNVG